MKNNLILRKFDALGAFYRKIFIKGHIIRLFNNKCVNRDILDSQNLYLTLYLANFNKNRRRK